MRPTNIITTAFVTPLIVTSLLLPVSFLNAEASAQRQPSPIPVTNTTPVGEPERVDLGGGKYKLVYRNSSGQIIREQEHDGNKIKTKFVKSVYPGGQVAQATIGHYDPNRFSQIREVVRYDSSGAPQEREMREGDGDYLREKWNPDAKRWDEAPEKQKWNPYTGRWEDVPPNQRFDPRRGVWERQNPETGRWEDVPESPEDILEELTPGGRVFASAAPSQSRSSAKSGHAVATEVVGGLNTTIFSTPRGKIRVNLPDDMAAGDTLSGTVSTQPEGMDQNEQARNQGELSGYVIEIEKQQTSSTGRIFKLAVPTAISTTHLILRGKKGEEIARREISVTRQPAPVEEFDLPTLGQQGRPIEVRGPCDGDFGTTNLKVGGEKLEMLAESPRKIVARNTSKQTGLSELEVNERGQTAKGEFRTLGIKLSASKLDLLRGEQTTLIVTVSGLEGIQEAVPLELENKSSSVIQMGGGEVQRINISPSQVQGDTYTTERPLTGIQRGAFTIIGTVISSRQRPEGATTRVTRPQVPEIAGLPPGFMQCDVECPAPVPVGGQTGRIRCPTNTACRQAGCDCLMFRRKRGTTDLERDPDGDTKAPGAIEDKNYSYKCYCVK